MKGILMEEEKIILAVWKSSPILSDADIVRFYSEMIVNAEVNVGRTTTNDVLITENTVKVLKQRRNELAGKLIEKYI